MKHHACLVVLFTAAFVFGGCARHEGPKNGQLTLGMVTDVGGLGDKSFNDSAYRGLQQAESSLGAYIQVLQSRSAADYQPNLSVLTNRRFDMIYAIGFLMSKDVDSIAKQNPKQHYAIVDAVVNDPNVLSITFKEEDGSFLAGALAAMVSKARHIAFIGGIDSPLIEKFEAGYVAGAREVDPATKVDIKYAGSFDDVASGSELANLLFGSGADIIYTAAGKVGVGAIDAVKTRPNDYIIGVDSDQDDMAPGRVLTSMVKHVDVAVYRSAVAVQKGKPMTGHIELGLPDQAIGLTDFKYTKTQIGAATLRRLAAIQRAIVAGRIVPPATRAQLAAFKPVSL